MDIECRLAAIREGLKEEALNGHQLLSDIGISVPRRPIVAELFLLSSGFGSTEVRSIDSIGVSLELMELAVVLHYEEESADRNLALIAGDYYYARSISIASGILYARAVEALSRAIGEISSVEVVFDLTRDGEGIELCRKRSGLFAVAGELGGDMVGLDEERIAALSEFARCVGVVHLVASEGIPPAQAKELPSLEDLTKEAVEVLGSFRTRGDSTVETTVESLKAFLYEISAGKTGGGS